MKTTATRIVLALIAVATVGAGIAGARLRTIEMEGRTALVVGNTKHRLQKTGREKDVTDFDIDFGDRVWTGQTGIGGGVDVSGTYQFSGKGGRKVDLTFDIASIIAFEKALGRDASAILLDKDGTDSAVTVEITKYKLALTVTQNRRKSKLKGKFRYESTVDETGDERKGSHGLKMKGAITKPDDK